MSRILDSDIKFLPGVGPKRAELLSKELGISTFRDMLYTFPFRYIDRSRFYSVREIDSSAVYVQLRGRITRIDKAGSGRNLRLIAKFTDGTGYIDIGYDNFLFPDETDDRYLVTDFDGYWMCVDGHPAAFYKIGRAHV